MLDKNDSKGNDDDRGVRLGVGEQDRNQTAYSPLVMTSVRGERSRAPLLATLACATERSTRHESHPIGRLDVCVRVSDRTTSDQT